MGLGLTGILALTSVAAFADGHGGHNAGNAAFADRAPKEFRALTDEEKAQMDANRAAKFQAMRDNAEGFARHDSVFTDEEKADMRANMLAGLKARLDAKVAAGDLTQEQAEQVYAAAEQGGRRQHGTRGHKGGAFAGKHQRTPAEEIATESPDTAR
jgi:hypothetical protein